MSVNMLLINYHLRHFLFYSMQTNGDTCNVKDEIESTGTVAGRVVSQDVDPGTQEQYKRARSW